MMLKEISSAPKKGILYAVYTDRIDFHPYSKNDIMFKKFTDVSDNLLELHLFDADTEYRYLKLRGNIVEMLICDDKWTLFFPLKENKTYERAKIKWDIYSECVYVIYDSPDKAYGFTNEDRITVVNYIQYDENDMIRMRNYRYSTKCSEEDGK